MNGTNGAVGGVLAAIGILLFFGGALFGTDYAMKQSFICYHPKTPSPRAIALSLLIGGILALGGFVLMYLKV